MAVHKNIKLSKTQWDMATKMGHERYQLNREFGNPRKATHMNVYEADALGVRCEAAFMKFHRGEIDWKKLADFKSRKSGDYRNIEIKGTQGRYHRLAVYPDHDSDRKFLLVREWNGVHYFVGWNWGHVIKKYPLMKSKDPKGKPYHLLPNNKLLSVDLVFTPLK